MRAILDTSVFLARVMDLLIAATARTHDAVLYTLYPGDLAGLDELVDIRTPAT